jgi:hypothetical protein
VCRLGVAGTWAAWKGCYLCVHTVRMIGRLSQLVHSVKRNSVRARSSDVMGAATVHSFYGIVQK